MWGRPEAPWEGNQSQGKGNQPAGKNYGPAGKTSYGRVNRWTPTFEKIPEKPVTPLVQKSEQPPQKGPRNKGYNSPDEREMSDSEIEAHRRAPPPEEYDVTPAPDLLSCLCRAEWKGCVLA